MSYPEPIPPIKGSDAEAFLRRLESFTPTAEQKAFCKGARKMHLEMAPKDPPGRK